MKKIFHEYGGVIITVIAIVALIGLVTLLMQPGGLMEGAFGNISQSFVDKSNSLIADAGVSNGGSGGSTPDSTSVIPEGGTYTTASGEVYNAGSAFPATVSDGDTYTYGDYEYRYNQRNSGTTYVTWNDNPEQDGWGVALNSAVTDRNQTSYGAILASINNAPVTNMDNMFDSCCYITEAPAIPDSVTSLRGTFTLCFSMTVAPEIPGSVTDMFYTFDKCSALSVAPTIPTSVTEMRGAFRETSVDAVEIPCTCEGQDIWEHCDVTIKHFEGCGH